MQCEVLVDIFEFIECVSSALAVFQESGSQNFEVLFRNEACRQVKLSAHYSL
jgi:hypothetical protein